MKSKKLILFSVAVICIVLLCAFTVIPTIRLSYDSKHNVDVSYRSAQADTEKITLTVDYTSSGEFFEIGRDIVVATDSSFDNTLKMTRCTVKDGNYVYEFDSSNLGDAKTVYIKPPVLYMPTEITPVSVPLIVGNAVKISPEDVSLKTAGENWFSIDAIDIEESSKGIYTAKITIVANTKDLPRFPTLLCGDTQIGGISTLHFDTSDNFKSGEFLFSVNAASREEALKIVSTSSLVISDALIRVDSSGMTASSDVKSLSVVVSKYE